jgi:hypothetical protein
MDGDAIRARDRLLLAGIGAATLPATFDSTLDEICGRFFPWRSRQCLPLLLTLSASLGPRVWRACDRGLVPLPWSNDAQNKREPSEDDCFAAPTAVGIHQGSSHGEC